ncbi:MAG TPA: alanine racemase, partial [Rhizobium sp.]|nr:alanine racemase [Rhizobium sp.]
MAALTGKVRQSVVVDSETIIEGLSARFAREPQHLTVLVECNTGADRCGVASPEVTAKLESVRFRL